MQKTFKFIILVLSIIILLTLSACTVTKKSKKHSPPLSKANTEFYKTYSEKFGYKLSGTESKRFIEEINSWLGTPYKYGGASKQGTDCSGLIKTFYKDVYNLDLYRSAADLLKNVKVIDKKDLSEGDIVFFKINSDKVSHVGMYISNNKFIHASVKRGVTINDLNEAYYLKYYFCSGKIINRK